MYSRLCSNDRPPAQPPLQADTPCQEQDEARKIQAPMAVPTPSSAKCAAVARRCGVPEQQRVHRSAGERAQVEPVPAQTQPRGARGAVIETVELPNVLAADRRATAALAE